MMRSTLSLAISTGLLSLATSGLSATLELEHSKGREQTIEVGYENGFENEEILGGHIWVDLDAFSFEGREIVDAEFDVNRFVIHMPFEIHRLNGKTVSINDGSLIHGEGGKVQIRSRELNESIAVKNLKITFKKVDNWIYHASINGELAKTKSPGVVPFKLDTPLKLQFAYHAPIGFPGPTVINDALKAMGNPGLGTRMNFGYWKSQHGDEWHSTFMKLEFEFSETYREWTKDLSVLKTGKDFKPRGINLEETSTPGVDPFLTNNQVRTITYNLSVDSPESVVNIDFWFKGDEIKDLTFYALPGKEKKHGYIAADPAENQLYFFVKQKKEDPDPLRVGKPTH